MVKTQSKFSLSDKVALVTGAAGLLGRQHCLALGELGAKVIATDLSETQLEDTLKFLRSEDPQGKYYANVLDVTSEKSIQTCLKTSINDFSRMDILINNAAIDPKVKKETSPDKISLEKSRLENFELSNWDFQIQVGLTGAMLCTKHFGAYMASNHGGVILNIASDLAVFSPDQRIYRKQGLAENEQPVKPVTYSVIKHGLIGLTKYTSTYWKNVRVNALSPGGVFNNQPTEFVDKLTQLIPQGRMAQKDEYRAAVQFLCSDASAYMSGQNLVMDGGRSVW